MALNATAKALIPSVVAALLLAFICVQPHFGAALYFFVLSWLLWLPYSAYIILRKPQRKRLQTLRVVLWLSTASVIACVHWIRHNATRTVADEVVFKILSYSAAHGEYPASLAEIGVSKDALKAKLSMGSYWRDEAGKPIFIYAGTFEPFSAYSYDFEKQLWVYEHD